MCDIYTHVCGNRRDSEVSADLEIGIVGN